jgi:hypothetical protein
MMRHPDCKPHTPESVGLNSGEVDRMARTEHAHLPASTKNDVRIALRLGDRTPKTLCFKYDSLQFIVFLVG